MKNFIDSLTQLTETQATIAIIALIILIVVMLLAVFFVLTKIITLRVDRLAHGQPSQPEPQPSNVVPSPPEELERYAPNQTVVDSLNNEQRANEAQLQIGEMLQTKYKMIRVEYVGERDIHVYRHGRRVGLVRLYGHERITPRAIYDLLDDQQTIGVNSLMIVAHGVIDNAAQDLIRRNRVRIYR